MNLVESLRILAERLEAFREDSDYYDAIENATLDLISHDDFEILPENIQELIYTLDMNDLNELNGIEIATIVDKLKAYIRTGDKE